MSGRRWAVIGRGRRLGVGGDSRGRGSVYGSQGWVDRWQNLLDVACSPDWTSKSMQGRFLHYELDIVWNLNVELLGYRRYAVQNQAGYSEPPSITQTPSQCMLSCLQYRLLPIMAKGHINTRTKPSLVNRYYSSRNSSPIKHQISLLIL